MKIGTHRQSETTIGLFLNTPRSRFVVPSFLTSIKPLSPDLKGGGRHACHAEKCKWQRSREKEERARLEVETLLSPLTEAIPPPDPRPHISGWTLNLWPHQWGRVPPRVVYAHTQYIFRHPLACGQAAITWRLYQCRCVGDSCPLGVKHRGQAPDLSVKC